LAWLISSCVALTALVGSPCVSRITISIMRPLTPPPALIALTAKSTPRLKPMVGAELGPVIAARQPILIGSDCAIAGIGNENVAAPNVPAPPNNSSRRETAMTSSRSFPQVGVRRLRIISCALQVRTTGVALARLCRPWSVTARGEFEPDGSGMSRGLNI
jgi:hypothetical protein